MVLQGDDMPENMKHGFNSGKLRGVQLFDCQPGKGYFISLNRCKPDSRAHVIQQGQKE